GSRGTTRNSHGDNPWLAWPPSSRFAPMKSYCRVCVFLMAFVAAPAFGDELKTLNGKVIAGNLQKITGNSIVVKEGANDIDTPLAQVLDVTLRTGKSLPTAANYDEIRLVDDSILRCTKVDLQAKEFEATLTTGLKIKLPLTMLASYLRNAQNSD